MLRTATVFALVSGTVFGQVAPPKPEFEVATVRVNKSGARIDLPQGTLDLLILKTVALEPQHGWAISERVQQMSSEALQVQQGSLYPALHRLERRGSITARWKTTDNNRRAKYYELTRVGEKQLQAQTESWRRRVSAVITAKVESSHRARSAYRRSLFLVDGDFEFLTQEDLQHHSEGCFQRVGRRLPDDVKMVRF